MRFPLHRTTLKLVSGFPPWGGSQLCYSTSHQSNHNMWPQLRQGPQSASRTDIVLPAIKDTRQLSLCEASAVCLLSMGKKRSRKYNQVSRFLNAGKVNITTEPLQYLKAQLEVCYPLELRETACHYPCCHCHLSLVFSFYKAAEKDVVEQWCV